MDIGHWLGVFLVGFSMWGLLGYRIAMLKGVKSSTLRAWHRGGEHMSVDTHEVDVDEPSVTGVCLAWRKLRLTEIRYGLLSLLMATLGLWLIVTEGYLKTIPVESQVAFVSAMLGGACLASWCISNAIQAGQVIERYEVIIRDETERLSGASAQATG